MNNEKGQALITVLLVSLIFTVLGLTIVAASINSNQRTGVRIDDIELTAEATRTLNEAIAIFSSKVYNDIDLSEPNLLNGDLDNILLAKIKAELEDKYSTNLLIEDITATEDYGSIDKTKYLTRIFRFSYTNQNTDGAEITKTVSRVVYLAPTPSFLKYAIGSGPEGEVYLNGAAEIVGDLFGGTIYTDDKALFTDLYGRRNTETLLPRILPSSENIGGSVFYRNEKENSLTLSEDVDKYFDEPTPTIVKDTAEFINVNFENTLAQIFNEITGSNNFVGSDFTSSSAISNVVDELSQDSSVEEIDYCEETSPIGAQTAKAYIYNSNIIQGDNCNPFLKNSWFIINGDLQIPRDTEVPGNIIVTGDLIIQGNEFDNSLSNNETETEEDDNIYFNSTIYVMGKTSITNTNIKRLNSVPSSKLILLTKGKLSIYRINEFSSSKNIEPLDAFFYTDTEAELYGVASLFEINGGLFANKKLTVNAIRQNSFSIRTDDIKSVIEPVTVQRSNDSRFFVEHDRSVLLDPNRLNSLPRVDRYQLLYDQVIVKNGNVNN